MTISVTQEHIDKGNQASDTECAIALAFEAAGFNVSIGDDEVSFYENGNGLCNHLGDLPLPADARFWNNRLDMGQKVEPFTFEMPGLMIDLSSFSLPPSSFQSVPVT